MTHEFHERLALARDFQEADLIDVTATFYFQDDWLKPIGRSNVHSRAYPLFFEKSDGTLITFSVTGQHNPSNGALLKTYIPAEHGDHDFDQEDAYSFVHAYNRMAKNLAYLQDTQRRRELWIQQHVEAEGFDRHASFDEVWKSVTEERDRLQKQLDEVTADRDKIKHDLTMEINGLKADQHLAFSNIVDCCRQLFEAADAPNASFSDPAMVEAKALYRRLLGGKGVPGIFWAAKPADRAYHPNGETYSTYLGIKDGVHMIRFIGGGMEYAVNDGGYPIDTSLRYEDYGVERIEAFK